MGATKRICTWPLVERLSAETAQLASEYDERDSERECWERSPYVHLCAADIGEEMVQYLHVLTSRAHEMLHKVETANEMFNFQ